MSISSSSDTNRHTRRLLRGLLLGVLLVVAGQAEAMTTQQTEAYGPATPDFTQNLTFDKFDPSLGTLNSVKVALAVATNGGELRVDNDGQANATVRVELGVAAMIRSMDVILLGSSFQPVVGTVVASTSDIFLLSPDNGDGSSNVDPNPPDGATLSGGNVNSDNMGFINSLFLNDFIGTGQTFNLTVAVQQVLDFGGIGGVDGSFRATLAEGNATVLYDFNPVERPPQTVIPEPLTATFGMMGLGALGLVTRRRHIA